MAATVEICESNGAGETVTHNITNTNWGSTDSANLNAVSNPITPGSNSYEKWQRLHVTAMGGSSRIDNVKRWRTGSLAANSTHVTNARTSSYGGAQSYAQPSASDRSATYGYTQSVVTSTPGSANVGIAGSLSGSLTGTGYSDYSIEQIQTNVSALVGTTVTDNWSYDETA